jgi:integrase
MKVIRKAVEGVPGLIESKYIKGNGGVSVRYFARIKEKGGERQPLFALGSDLEQATDRLTEIRIAQRRGEDLSKFKRQRKTGKARVAPTPEAMTFRRYAEIYLAKPQAQALKSHPRDCDYVKHLNEFFGDLPLSGGIKRRHLFEYRDKRLTEFKMIRGKPTKSRVSRGQITNELSCLRKILHAAATDDYRVVIPSFEDKTSKQNERLMWRHPGRDRILEQDEKTRLLAAVPFWVAWVIRFAIETALNLGDCIEMKKTWIDRKNRLVKVPDGRNKSGVEQSPYLYGEARAILDEIELARREVKIASNIEGYMFTRPDGSKLTKDEIEGYITRARKKAKVSDWRFHDTRHEAQTAWSIDNVPDAIAMKMAGLKSPQMRQRYTNIKPRHVAEYMANLEKAKKKLVTQN